jgi:hypothetical protein
LTQADTLSEASLKLSTTEPRLMSLLVLKPCALHLGLDIVGCGGLKNYWLA